MRPNETRIIINTAPTLEPVTLDEAKNHIRLNSGSFENYITSTQSIEPADYAAGTQTGTGVDVLNTQSNVYIHAGVLQATSTLDVTIQESDDNVAWTDWAGSSFAQITTANDQDTFEQQYTGLKRYVRARAVVANANAIFDVTVTTGTAITVEDSLVTNWITRARQIVEFHSNKTLITQTWDYWLDDWPNERIIDLPKPPLQSITHIQYYKTDNTANTFSNTKYTLDANDTEGRVFLNDGESWGDGNTLRDYKGVNIRIVTGYGDTAADVPEYFKQAILLIVGHFFEHRENTTEINVRTLPFDMRTVIGYDRNIPI